MILVKRRTAYVPALLVILGGLLWGAPWLASVEGKKAMSTVKTGGSATIAVPPIDSRAPDKIETATFAMG